VAKPYGLAVQTETATRQLPAPLSAQARSAAASAAPRDVRHANPQPMPFELFTVASAAQAPFQNRITTAQFWWPHCEMALRSARDWVG
jgi:hypothetical protein